ncbi:TetR/AcrR family transcriptional regulator [Paenibacillus barcinonensis]|uniref:TetR/AcrR family transcriptional regulator n=1 Tax=Paenibacillus TaxID=44249 RepID=UPI001C100FFD|nr:MULTISPECIES: TetR/AcrR family transcriptional regulator [Paenibacillus]MBU5352639.1 TetR/AcrR family transcriptional regulator [Paenibacillus barcinonensis]MDM5281246.1 TetR/AcrR family transcriptional regulator [Paenibacillus silvae]
MNPIHEMNEKRKLIITTALKLFSAKGSAATSMQEIAELCGMSKGSLYLMFKSKEELEASTLEYCVYVLIDEMSQIEHETSLTSRERLHKQIEALLTHVAELKEFLRVQMRSMMMDDEQQRKENCTPQQRDIEIRTLHWFKSKLEDLYGPEIEPYTIDLVMLTHGLFLSYVKIWFTEMPSLTVNKMATNLLQMIDYAAAGYLQQHPVPLFPLEQWPAWVAEAQPDSAIPRHPVHILKQMQDIASRELPAGQSRNDVLETIAILRQEIMEFSPRRAIILGMMRNLEGIALLEPMHSELQHIMDTMYNRFIQADSSNT